jgi:hypothetical protein
MKVIKSGRLPDWTTEVKCKCGAVLEVSADDIGIAYTPSEDYYSGTFTCPECKLTQVSGADQSILSKLYQQRRVDGELAEAYYSK